MTSEPSATETASTGQLSALNINVGANVTELRENKHLSMYDVAKAMKKLDHSWSKTTLFNIEHNSRRLQAVEAFDLLRCMGYRPETDLMLLYRDSPHKSTFPLKIAHSLATNAKSAGANTGNHANLRKPASMKPPKPAPLPKSVPII